MRTRHHVFSPAGRLSPRHSPPYSSCPRGQSASPPSRLPCRILASVAGHHARGRSQIGTRTRTTPEMQASTMSRVATVFFLLTLTVAGFSVGHCRHGFNAPPPIRHVALVAFPLSGAFQTWAMIVNPFLFTRRADSDRTRSPCHCQRPLQAHAASRLSRYVDFCSLQRSRNWLVAGVDSCLRLCLRDTPKNLLRRQISQEQPARLHRLCVSRSVGTSCSVGTQKEDSCRTYNINP